MSDLRHRDVIWNLHANPDGTVTTESVQAALLMDLRDRLDVLRCPDFREIPYLLRQIKWALQKPAGPSKPQRLAARLAHHRAAVRRARRTR